MIALGERDRLVKLCKTIIDMQNQKCYVKENRVGGMETQVPLFPINIESEVDASQMFVQFCHEGFNNLKAEQYLNFYSIVKASIIDCIESIVTDETHDETLLRGFLQPTSDGDFYEERKF